MFVTFLCCKCVNHNMSWGLFLQGNSVIVLYIKELVKRLIKGRYNHDQPSKSYKDKQKPLPAPKYFDIYDSVLSKNQLLTI